MVVIKQPSAFGRQSTFHLRLTHVLTLSALLILLFIGRSVLVDTSASSSLSSSQANDRQLRTERVNRPNRPQSIEIVLEDESQWVKDKVPESTTKQFPCSYRSLSDLPRRELYPTQGDRHMINPPLGGKVSLVCCTTTAGPLNIMAHHKWAPHGAQRFMAMVTSGYFDSSVPFMRCLKGFLCQFGLNSDSSKSKDFQQTIDDDPNWLPEGPSGRKNEQGVKRFAQGYLAYAGSGKHSRSKQLIIALQANGPLAGGSPWEVPWGEIVHPESFETLGKIYTGYGDNGPPQGQLGPKGMTPEMKQQWPDLDYIQNCQLVDERDLGDDLSSQ